MILKGQHINLKLNGNVIAKSTNCSLNITANTTDESSKDDSNPMFDSPSVSNSTWTCSNESFIVDVASLVRLISLFKSHNAVEVELNDPQNVTESYGFALITGLTVTASNGENATVRLSFQGKGAIV